MTEGLTRAATQFVDLLCRRIVDTAQGAGESTCRVAPKARFWLGLLASEESVQTSRFGERGERMRPCAIGFRLRPDGPGPWRGQVTLRAAAWWKAGPDDWRKTEVVEESLPMAVSTSSRFPIQLPLRRLGDQLAAAIGQGGHAAEVRIELETGSDGGPEMVVQVVNVSPAEHDELDDTHLYQVELEVEGILTRPFLLEGLPDSFRYDRRVPAYGLNCGVQVAPGGAFRSVDAVAVDRGRPEFWSGGAEPPDLRFAVLAEDPLPQLERLVEAHARWGETAWGTGELARRAQDERWTSVMREEAARGVEEFRAEAGRLRNGLDLLRRDERLLRAYRLTNRAMQLASRGKYDSWRPFQVGFQLAALASVLGGDDEVSVVDVLWFATGGGKTETYLGILVLAALFDRIRGKTHGMTAWSRFPLRLLSLQQTQRFADAVAAAELVRREEELGGEPFRLGFFVGGSNTPNEIKAEPEPGKPDPYDPNMPKQYQVLRACPFCGGAIEMGFDTGSWILEHRCRNEECPWPERGLPCHVVDMEIYRLLPTVVVGTLDKAALVGFQGAMRGFVGPPLGYCSEEGHGHTYATRSKRPTGCLVPDCKGQLAPLPQSGELYRLSFRLQDELHLLRDSLGAVDSHYESLLDALSAELTGGRPKILASSATLSGYENQCRTLYQRASRAFPALGPRAGESFWLRESASLLRRYVALAPRGVTLEYAVDRMLTELQQAMRDVLREPEVVARSLGIEPGQVAALVNLFGTDVVYGNTIRDLQASLRSIETQVQVGRLQTEELTGHTPFEQVRRVLERLEKPEEEFEDRVHVVAASSMMSHGVDIDRLNRMIVLGQPLTTAEFIQATARIGRRWPGLVFVLHKMGRERDAGLLRSFDAFVRQGDRFVDAIPITRRSRRVLDRTVSGLGNGRLLMVGEPLHGRLTTQRAVDQAVRAGKIVADQEIDALQDALGLIGEDDGPLREVVRSNVEVFFRRVQDPTERVRFPSELWPRSPMTSLRDVEEQLPVSDED